MRFLCLFDARCEMLTKVLCPFNYSAESCSCFSISFNCSLIVPSYEPFMSLFGFASLTPLRVQLLSCFLELHASFQQACLSRQCFKASLILIHPSQLHPLWSVLSHIGFFVIKFQIFERNFIFFLLKFLTTLLGLF